VSYILDQVFILFPFYAFVETNKLTTVQSNWMGSYKLVMRGLNNFHDFWLWTNFNEFNKFGKIREFKPLYRFPTRVKNMENTAS
jgi:hypothetical protein